MTRPSPPGAGQILEMTDDYVIFNTTGQFCRAVTVDRAVWDRFPHRHPIVKLVSGFERVMFVMPLGMKPREVSLLSIVTQGKSRGNKVIFKNGKQFDYRGENIELVGKKNEPPRQVPKLTTEERAENYRERLQQSVKPENEAKRKLPPGYPKQRACLRCDDQFRSVGPENRLCHRCGRLNAETDEECLYPSPGGGARTQVRRY